MPPLQAQKNFIVDVPQAAYGKRVDVFLTQAMAPSLSRSRIKALILSGYLSIHDQIICDPNYALKPQDILSLTLPPAEPSLLQPCKIPLDLLFEDEDVIVLNKPANLVVHPGAGNREGTLVQGLLEHCGPDLSHLGGLARPGIVHRLDKDTTGLMVIAKTDEAHRDLTRQFASKKQGGPLERIYCALVWGKPDLPQGIIETQIGRDPKNRLKMAVLRSPDQGRLASTYYRVERSFYHHEKCLASLLSCTLLTGRTHQIRVHMTHLGTPLLGDPLYANAYKTRENILTPQAKHALSLLRRQALHAQSLTFQHPRTKENLTFSHPPPLDFCTLLDALSSP